MAAQRRNRRTRTDQHLRPQFGRYILSGILTVIPLWITWIVFDFVFRQFSHLGMPWVRAFSRHIREESPTAARILLEPWFQELMAVLITLVGLYVIGWAATKVIGRRILRFIEAAFNRIPFVKPVYGSVKKLVAVMQEKPEGVQRVVLIEFPSSQMKAVGFVTRTLVDEETGQMLAAVYVPTTPNPTSGYLEIVPLERVVSTDWTINEAMNFVISGGANAPDRFRFASPMASEAKEFRQRQQPRDDAGIAGNAGDPTFGPTGSTND
jgi:uncharacterized membrane protein